MLLKVYLIAVIISFIIFAFACYAPYEEDDSKIVNPLWVVLGALIFPATWIMVIMEYGNQKKIEMDKKRAIKNTK